MGQAPKTPQVGITDPASGPVAPTRAAGPATNVIAIRGSIDIDAPPDLVLKLVPDPPEAA